MSARPDFSWACRVYWAATDAGGVVYYANYLKFMERCRTEWLRSLGIDQRRLREERGVQFAVVDLTITYHKAARLDDEISVTATLERLGGATIEFSQSVRREQAILVDARVRVACVDSARMAARAIPKDLFGEWRRGQ